MLGLGLLLELLDPLLYIVLWWMSVNGVITYITEALLIVTKI